MENIFPLLTALILQVAFAFIWYKTGYNKRGKDLEESTNFTFRKGNKPIGYIEKVQGDYILTVFDKEALKIKNN